MNQADPGHRDNERNPTMAAASKLVGRFIAAKHSEWTEPIKGEDGRGDTPPGQSLTVWVFTEHDADVCKVKFSTVGRKADAPALFAARAVCEKLTFGAAVTVNCGALSYGAYQGYTIEPDVKAPAPSSAPAGARAA